MNYIHALICTRSNDLTPITKNLLEYLEGVQAKVNLLVNKNSIFKAYEEGFNLIPNKRGDDIVILCHDDIEIYNKPSHFKFILQNYLKDPKARFIGPAGTTELNNTAVWWDQVNWQQKKHRGFVFHGTKLKEHATYYGDYGPAVVLDGLFLAAKISTLGYIGLHKPSTFIGNWDFYDILYTYRAHKAGLTNKVAPILLRHESMGELAGRDSWHKNRQEFIKLVGDKFPITL